MAKAQSQLSIVHSDGLAAVGMKPRQSFVFGSAAGGAQLWRVANDGFLTGAYCTFTSVVISSESLTVAAAEARNSYLPEIIAIAQNTAGGAVNLNYPIKSGDVYVLNFTAGGILLLSVEPL